MYGVFCMCTVLVKSNENLLLVNEHTCGLESFQYIHVVGPGFEERGASLPPSRLAFLFLSHSSHFIPVFGAQQACFKAKFSAWNVAKSRWFPMLFGSQPYCWHNGFFYLQVIESSNVVLKFRHWGKRDLCRHSNVLLFHSVMSWENKAWWSLLPVFLPVRLNFISFFSSCYDRNYTKSVQSCRRKWL